MSLRCPVRGSVPSLSSSFRTTVLLVLSLPVILPSNTPSRSRNSCRFTPFFTLAPFFIFVRPRSTYFLHYVLYCIPRHNFSNSCHSISPNHFSFHQTSPVSQFFAFKLTFYGVNSYSGPIVPLVLSLTNSCLSLSIIRLFMEFLNESTKNFFYFC